MLQQTITLVLVLASALAAVACVWACWNVHRSTLAAKAFAKHAENAERRALLRELTVTAHRVIAESSEMGLLIEDLKTEYRVLANFSGQSGGSREKLLVQRAESKQKQILPLYEEAQKLVQERTQLLNASEDELTEILIKFDGFLAQVLRIKDVLQREVAAVAGENRIHRGRHVRALNLTQ